MLFGFKCMKKVMLHRDVQLRLRETFNSAFKYNMFLYSSLIVNKNVAS